MNLGSNLKTFTAEVKIQTKIFRVDSRALPLWMESEANSEFQSQLKSNVGGGTTSYYLLSLLPLQFLPMNILF